MYLKLCSKDYRVNLGEGCKVLQGEYGIFSEKRGKMITKNYNKNDSRKLIAKKM
jgi:hypothetical protein